MASLAPEAVHGRLLAAARPAFAYDGARPLGELVQAMRPLLLELLAVPAGDGPVDVRIEHERPIEGGREVRFLFTSEPGADVPCHLLIPEAAPRPVPVVICLQGHSAGMRLSLGEPGDDRERDFARQALRHGHAALALEIRGFGERRDRRPATQREDRYAPDSLDPHVTCQHAAMTALLLGRTSLGEKLLDLVRAIDALAAFPEVDREGVVLIGNSGGGTLAWYAACIEPRVRGLILGSCFSTYAASIGTVDHCCDNYLPGALRWFDFPDLAALVAPRPLVVVMGRDDPLFPGAGVEAAFARTRAIYEAAGAAGRCRLMLLEGGHRFYAGPAWRAFAELMEDP